LKEKLVGLVVRGDIFQIFVICCLLFILGVNDQVLVVTPVAVGDGDAEELQNQLALGLKAAQLVHDGLPVVTKLNYGRQQLLLLIFS
jgi:hypothetical protein